MDTGTTLTLLGILAGLAGAAGMLKENGPQDERELVPVPVPVEEKKEHPKRR